MHPLPDSLSDAEAVLLEPLGVALHALDLGLVRPGTAAGVFGCGPLGLLLVELLRTAGASVRGGRPAPPSGWPPPSGSARPRPPGRLRLDVAFEVAGDDGALDDAIDALRPGGRVVLVGIPDGDRTSFTASTARRKELTIALCRRMKPADLPRAIRLAENGRIELAPLVTDRYPLADWGQAFDHLVERRGLKVVVEPRAER